MADATVTMSSVRFYEPKDEELRKSVDAALRVNPSSDLKQIHSALLRQNRTWIVTERQLDEVYSHFHTDTVSASSKKLIRAYEPAKWELEKAIEIILEENPTAGMKDVKVMLLNRHKTWKLKGGHFAAIYKRVTEPDDAASSARGGGSLRNFLSRSGNPNRSSNGSLVSLGASTINSKEVRGNFPKRASNNSLASLTSVTSSGTSTVNSTKVVRSSIPTRSSNKSLTALASLETNKENRSNIPRRSSNNSMASVTSITSSGTSTVNSSTEVRERQPLKQSVPVMESSIGLDLDLSENMEEDVGTAVISRNEVVSITEKSQVQDVSDTLNQIKSTPKDEVSVVAGALCVAADGDVSAINMEASIGLDLALSSAEEKMDQDVGIAVISPNEVFLDSSTSTANEKAIAEKSHVQDVSDTLNQIKSTPKGEVNAVAGVLSVAPDENVSANNMASVQCGVLSVVPDEDVSTNNMASVRCVAPNEGVVASSLALNFTNWISHSSVFGGSTGLSTFQVGAGVCLATGLMFFVLRTTAPKPSRF